MRRIKLKKHKKFDKLSFLSFVMILIFIAICFTLWLISKLIGPSIMVFAELETKRLANIIINKAVSDEIVNDIDIDKLFDTIKNNDGEIQTIDFNPIVVNNVLSKMTNVVETNLVAIERGKIDAIQLPDEILREYDKNNLRRGIIYSIPIGSVTKNAFLSNLGPHIPVKMNIIGSVLSHINTKINQYGINNALIQVSVHMEVEEQVTIPLLSKKVIISSDIPVAMKIIAGRIPQYYQEGGINRNSSILSLPIE